MSRRDRQRRSRINAGAVAGHSVIKLKSPRLVYTALRVSDMKRSIRFYTDALKMRLQIRFRIKETGGTVAYLVSPGGTQRLELNWYPGGKAYRRGDEHDHLDFKVPSLRVTHERLMAAGARLIIPTFKEGDMKLTFHEDPDVIPIEIMSSLRERFKAMP